MVSSWRFVAIRPLHCPCCLLLFAMVFVEASNVVITWDRGASATVMLLDIKAAAAIISDRTSLIGFECSLVLRLNGFFYLGGRKGRGVHR